MTDAPVARTDETHKHTPGPWVAAASPSSIVGWPIIGPGGRAVASVHYRRGDTAEGQQINAEAGANARLIAAAPDLLAALKAMMKYYDTPSAPWALLDPEACKAMLEEYGGIDRVCGDMAKDAIAKAEGPSS